MNEPPMPAAKSRGQSSGLFRSSNKCANHPDAIPITMNARIRYTLRSVRRLVSDNVRAVK